MRGKKRVKKNYPKPQLPEDDYARGDRCVYCGKKVDPDAPPCTAAAHLRRFPVCGEPCRDAAEAYVRADHRYKTWFYLLLFACALVILVSALLGQEGLVMYLAVCAAGAGFALMPYPISSFETFQSTPIRRVILFCRVFGALVVIGSLVFTLSTL